MNYDDLLAVLEDYLRHHAQQIMEERQRTSEELAAAIRAELPKTRGRSAQFGLITAALERAECRFASTCRGRPKELLMALARRAPIAFTEGGDRLLAALIVKHSAPDPGASFTERRGEQFLTGLIITHDDVACVFTLLAITRAMHNLQGLRRWLGKGGTLRRDAHLGVWVDLSDTVYSAVQAYERRRPAARLFHSGGFFEEARALRPSGYLIPMIATLPPAYFEAPAGSRRFLFFDRIPAVIDGRGYAQLLRAYDEPIQHDWNTTPDALLKFLTALASLLARSVPRVDLNASTISGVAGHQAFEHELRFLYSISRTGFLRMPKTYLVEQISECIPDNFPAGDLPAQVQNIIDTFLMTSETARSLDVTDPARVPFIHQSTEENIYVDILLLPDFLHGLLESGKRWYSSQHGDRYTLALMRWIELAATGAAVRAKRPVRLDDGSMGDVDLLIHSQNVLWAVECKALGKSPAFMRGEPEAIQRRRSKVREAVRQAKRAASALQEEISEGRTEFPGDTHVRWLVCTPTVEFLVPLDEYGFAMEGIPNVLTPEELLEVATCGSSGLRVRTRDSTQ